MWSACTKMPASGSFIGHFFRTQVNTSQQNFEYSKKKPPAPHWCRRFLRLLRFLRSHPGFIQVSSRFYPGLIQVLSRFYPGFIRGLSGFIRKPQLLLIRFLLLMRGKRIVTVRSHDKPGSRGNVCVFGKFQR